MVISIRGTSGSGKTTLVRHIMAAGQVTPLIVDKPKKPDGYRVIIPELDQPVMVVGSYENVCGGTDSISKQDEIEERVRAYAEHGHVLVEGLLMSASFGRWAVVDRDLAAKGIHFIWAFLDTPLEVCLERVNARRQARGETEPVNPENTTSKWHGVRRTAELAGSGVAADWKKLGRPAEKLDVRWVPYLTAGETVMGWLRESRA